MSPVPPLVRCSDVSRVYETRSDRVTALSGVNLSLQRGERVALLGRSGSGKSTLLNLLGGLDRVTSGSIQVDERELSRMSADQMASYRLQTVGMVYQAFHLIGSKTALQNVELPFMLTRMPKEKRRTRALEALASVGLKDRAEHRPAELSGGEQQRVAVARALANRPPLLLADEPTGNLDSTSAADIIRLLTDHSEQNRTSILIVTHDEELAHGFAHRILRMRDGIISDPSRYAVH